MFLLSYLTTQQRRRVAKRVHCTRNQTNFQTTRFFSIKQNSLFNIGFYFFIYNQAEAFQLSSEALVMMRKHEQMWKSVQWISLCVLKWQTQKPSTADEQDLRVTRKKRIKEREKQNEITNVKAK